MNKIALALLGAATILTPIMATAPVAAQASAQTPSQALAALFAASDAGELERNPIAALARGDTSKAGRIGNPLSDAYYAAERAAAERELAALAAIDRAQLTPDEQVSYDVFKWQRTMDLRGSSPRCWR